MLIEALHTDHPAADRAAGLTLYGWLVGDWNFTGWIQPADAVKHDIRGEIHAGWVLDGRAIQDVWIVPGFFHGTTLRIYDPGLDAWHIIWSDPLRQSYSRQMGRASGKNIVQDGANLNGTTTRWSFVDRTNDSFRWLGERLAGPDTWVLEAEFFVRRTR
jgi:hypothetical protein